MPDGQGIFLQLRESTVSRYLGPEPTPLPMLTLLGIVNCLLRKILKHVGHVVDSKPPIAV
jgi:hypothetical protein